MAPTFTATYQLGKADPQDMYDVTLVNGNLDKIEAGLVALAGVTGGVTFCTSTTRPTTPANGRQIYETDTRRGYIWNGSIWYQTYGPPVPVALTYGATINTNVALGRLFRVAMTGNAVLQAPTNPIDGIDAIWEISADASARTLTLQTGVAGGFVFGADVTALSATEANKTDILGAKYHAGTGRWRVVSYAKGYAAT